MEDAYGDQFMTQHRSQCLPWTWFYAVYMQLSILLPMIIYLHNRLLNQQCKKVFYILFILVPLIFKCITIKQIHDDLQGNNLPTKALTNPARNIAYYANQYILPHNHFPSFFIFGATAGYFFHLYLQVLNEKELNINTQRNS